MQAGFTRRELSGVHMTLVVLIEEHKGNSL